jgi:cobalt-precorrin 5A hydrolase
MQPVTVISLTVTGQNLAQRLRFFLPAAEYLHSPQPFKSIVQQRFLAGHRLVLICAMGIAVRTLAPVLQDKYQDPAVLVMDERGSFVIPLLSGHEGGANEWARQLSEWLDAQCVITGVRSYTRPLRIAGIGCERNCPLEAFYQLLDTTLPAYGLNHQALHAIASIERKRDEAGLLLLAEQLGISIDFYPASVLQKYAERLSQRSELVFRETGCYGVAEAAALAHAERIGKQRAELVIRKHKNTQATLAVAQVYIDTKC